MLAIKTQLIATLTIGLFACGGSPAKDSIPDTDTDTDAETEAAGGGTGGGADADAGDESASADERRRKPSHAGEFAINDADASSRPKQAKLKATETEAAVRFFVVDKDDGPIEGIVIKLTSPAGDTYHTPATDKDGFTEVLLPIGQTYSVVYLSLGRRDVAAKVDVADKPNLNLKLTMRYKRYEYVSGDGLVLENVQFESGKATITPASFKHLDELVEYMTYKKSARVEISGHTDNVGGKKANKRLSQKRANAVKEYLVSKGIAANRIKAVGYGDAKPIAPNDTAEGRQKNRRIEATEL